MNYSDFFFAPRFTSFAAAQLSVPSLTRPTTKCIHRPQFIYLLAPVVVDGRILFHIRQSTSDRIRLTFRPGAKSRDAQVRAADDRLTSTALKSDI